MAAYLQRLLDAAAPIRAEPPGLAPVVRSSSPVFEQNQLIALEAPVAGPSEARTIEPPADEWGEPWQEPVAVESGLPGEPRGPPPVPHQPAPRAVPHQPAPRAVPHPPAPRAAPSLLDDPPEAPPIGQDASFAEARPPTAAPALGTIVELPRRLPAARDRRSAPIEPPPLSSPRARAVAAGPAEVAQVVPPASPLRPEAAVVEPTDAGRRGETPPREATERQEAEPHLRTAGTDDVPTIDPPAAPDRGPEQPRIELSPRPPPDPVPADPHREAQAGPAEPVQPTITIGQVTVEVVEDSRPGSAAPQALTAASASMIGPLGQARAARRLIALRRL